MACPGSPVAGAPVHPGPGRLCEEGRERMWGGVPSIGGPGQAPSGPLARAGSEGLTAGKKGLIKDQGLPVGTPCPLVLAAVGHSPSSLSGLPRSTCSGCGSRDGDRRPSPVPPKPVSSPSPPAPWHEGPLGDLLEEERGLVETDSGGPAPHVPGYKAIEGSPLGIRVGLSPGSPRLWTGHPSLYAPISLL